MSDTKINVIRLFAGYSSVLSFMLLYQLLKLGQVYVGSGYVDSLFRKSAMNSLVLVTDTFSRTYVILQINVDQKESPSKYTTELQPMV